jgi:hypothetical protein
VYSILDVKSKSITRSRIVVNGPHFVLDPSRPLAIFHFFCGEVLAAKYVV